MSTPYGGTSGSYPGGGYDPAAQGVGGSPYDTGVEPGVGYGAGVQQGVGYDAGTTTAGATAAETSTPGVEDESIGSLVGRLSSDVSTLMRQELALAKAELREEATKAAKGAGMLGGAGLAGYFVALFLSLTLMWALGGALDLWLAALIVAVLWAIVAAVLFVMGRKQMKQVNPKPEQTVETLKEDKEWVKAQRS